MEAVDRYTRKRMAPGRGPVCVGVGAARRWLTCGAAPLGSDLGPRTLRGLGDMVPISDARRSRPALFTRRRGPRRRVFPRRAPEVGGRRRFSTRPRRSTGSAAGTTVARVATGSPECGGQSRAANSVRRSPARPQIPKRSWWCVGLFGVEPVRPPITSMEPFFDRSIRRSSDTMRLPIETRPRRRDNISRDTCLDDSTGEERWPTA